MNDDLTVHAEHSEFALPVAAPEPHKTLDIPPQLILECAAGLEDPAVIADRFGLRGAAWERLAQWPPFITAVQAQRSEFERNGYTFRMKAQLMADEVMGQMFKQAIGTDTTILQKLSVFNSLVDVAGLKAQKKEESAGQAAKFSITINIPQNTAPTPITIDG